MTNSRCLEYNFVHHLCQRNLLLNVLACLETCHLGGHFDAPLMGLLLHATFRGDRFQPNHPLDHFEFISLGLVNVQFVDDCFVFALSGHEVLKLISGVTERSASVLLFVGTFACFIFVQFFLLGNGFILNFGYRKLYD